jgi:hypothetical protein
MLKNKAACFPQKRSRSRRILTVNFREWQGYGLIYLNKIRESMTYYIIPAALIITFVIVLVFSLFTRRSMNGLWTLFLVVFLATWTGQLWIMPFGPVILGVSWIPLLVVALYLSVLIFALLPPVSDKSKDATPEATTLVVTGLLFWIILALLIASIALGYYRIA